MSENIKVSFTEEEISEYINELNNAKGNTRKINKLLDLSHLPILVAYLRKIGVDENLLSLAAVVEFTRYKMRDVLTSSAIKEWNVTDKGVSFEKHDKFPHSEMIGVDSKNTFWLGNDKFFSRRYREIDGELWPIDSYIYLKRKMYYYRDIDRPINRCGFAFCRFYVNGKYCVIDELKKGEDEIYYFITNITDVDGSKFKSKRIYAGEPIDVPETENTLRENYDMYTTLFPKYKEWLDGYFLQNGNSLDNTIRRVDSEIYKVRLMKLTGRIDILKNVVKEEFTRYKDNKRKLDTLSRFLGDYDCETEDGRNTIDGIKTDVDSRLMIDEDDVELVLDNCNYEESNTGLDDLEYETLKERAEKVADDTSKLEELIDILRNVNISNGKLIADIENRIKEIGKGKENKTVKEEAVNEHEGEIEF